MFKGYLSLGGNEIANTARVYAYVQNSGAGIPLRNCEDCDGVLRALGHEPYGSPLVDDAPWFDPNRPETQRFYGFYPLDVQGIEDSTREADVLESVQSGGWVGAVRDATRPIRVKGLLLAADELAMSAGMTWLRAALKPDECSSHGGSCGGAQLCYWSACPDVCDRWDRTFEAGEGIPFYNYTPASSPNILRYSGFETSIWRGTITWLTSQEGVIVRYGAVDVDDIDAWVPDEEHGPVVLRRVNYVPNPSFGNEDDPMYGWIDDGEGAYGFGSWGEPPPPGIPVTFLGIYEGGEPGGPFVYAWTGTPNASPSTASKGVEVAYTNAMPNPKMADADVAGVPIGYTAGPGAVLSGDVGGGALYLDADGTTIETYVTATSLVLAPGETYTALSSGYIDEFEPDVNASTYAGRMVLVIDGVPYQSSTHVWEEGITRFTFTVPATATTAELRYYLGTDSTLYTLNVFEWDIIASGPAGDPQPYMGFRFDGDSVATANRIFRTVDMVLPSAPIVVTLMAQAHTRGVPGLTVRLRQSSDDSIISEASFIIDFDWRTYTFNAASGGKAYLEFESAGEINLGRFDVEQGVTPLPYLDGSVPQEQALAGYLTHEIPDEYEIGWTGAPNASESYAQWVGKPVIGMPMADYGPGLDPLMNAGLCRAYPRIDVLQGEISGMWGFGYRLPIPYYQQVKRYERTMHDVTCVEGPRVISEKVFTSGALMREVDFLLVAGNPYAYGAEDQLLINQKFTELNTSPWIDQDCTVAAPVAIVDPDCPPTPAPPRPPSIPNSCVTEESVWQRYWVSIPDYLVSQWAVSSPKIVINTGAQAVRQMRVQVYPNPFQRDPDEGFTRLNRVTNPKAATATTGYVAAPGGGTSTLSRVTGQADPGGVGTNAIRSTATTAITGAWRVNYNVDIPAAGNRDWRAMVYLKSSIALNSRIKISYRNDANVELNYSESPVLVATAAYQKLMIAGRAPAGTTKILVMIGSSTGGAAINATFDVTGLVLEELPSGEKVKGAPVYSNDFSGGALPPLSPLYPTSGRIEMSPLGRPAVLFDATYQPAGTYPALRGVPTVTTAGKWHATRATFFQEPDAKFDYLYVYGDVDAGNTVTVQQEDTWGVVIEQPITNAMGLSNGGTAEIEAGLASAGFTKGKVWMTKLEVIEVDYPDSYFDGDSEPADGYFYGWTGTPGASTSVGLRPGVDACSYCSEFVVSYLPARTELTVDAIMQTAFASVSGADPAPATHLLYASDGSPMEWPELSCGQEYLLAIDVPKPLLADVTVDITVATRE